MKKVIGTIGVLLLLVLSACAPGGQTGGVQPTATEGRTVFTITDAAADMGAVSSVKVTVESVSVHSEATSWVTVSSTPQTYDLLALKAEGSQAVLADVVLGPGTYQQLRLDISKVVVTDASGDKEAKLPSGELKIVGDLVVEANTTSTATFDFIADESLHVTGKGEYILAPVVQLETKTNAQVDLKAGNKVEISGGTTKASLKVGMDITGKVGAGLGIAKDADLVIEAGGLKLGVGGGAKASGTGSASTGSSGGSASAKANASVQVEI